MKNTYIDVDKLENHELGIPEDMALLLDEELLLLLKCYLAGYTYCQIAKKFKHISNREKILEKLIFLGEELAIYRIFLNRFSCKTQKEVNPEYYQGWEDSLNHIRSTFYGTRQRWATYQARNKRKKRKS